MLSKLVPPFWTVLMQKSVTAPGASETATNVTDLRIDTDVPIVRQAFEAAMRRPRGQEDDIACLDWEM